MNPVACGADKLAVGVRVGPKGKGDPFPGEPAACASRGSLPVRSWQGISSKARSSVLSHLVPWKFERLWRHPRGCRRPCGLSPRKPGPPRDPGSRRVPARGRWGGRVAFSDSEAVLAGGRTMVSGTFLALLAERSKCPNTPALAPLPSSGEPQRLSNSRRHCVPSAAGRRAKSHIGRRWPKPPVKPRSLRKVTSGFPSPPRSPAPDPQQVTVTRETCRHCP